MAYVTLEGRKVAAAPRLRRMSQAEVAGWAGGRGQEESSNLFPPLSFTQSAEASQDAHGHTHTPHTDLIKFISYDLKNIFFLLCLHKKQLFPVYCKVFFTDTQVTRGARLVLYWNETWPEINAITLFSKWCTLAARCNLVLLWTL